MAARKPAGSEPSKLSASELAASILRKAQRDLEAEQAARLKDLAAYKAVLLELAAIAPEGRGVTEAQNLLAASRILGDRLGYCADSDLSSLDALNRERSMIEEHGDLYARELALNAELATGQDREQAMLERHASERGEFREYYRKTAQLAVQVGQVQAAAKAARLAVGHLLESEVQ